MSLVEPGMAAADLVPGDAEALDRLAARFREFAGTAADAVGGVERLDSGHWSGDAAERFRESIQRVPQQLRRAGEAFGSAERTIREHAAAVREGRHTAEYAVEIATEAAERSRTWAAGGSVGPDPGADDRERADRMVRTAQEHIHNAARTAAAHLHALARQAPAPAAQTVAGRLPALRHGDIVIKTSMEHPLQDADAFAGSTGESTAQVRYGSAHHVGFADGTNGSSWDHWVEAGSGRETGEVSDGTLSQAAQQLSESPMGLSGLGMAALGLGVLGVGARTRGRRTAMSVAGVDPSERTSRRGRRTGSIGGVPAPIAGAGKAWRTNLAAAPQQQALARPVRGTIGQQAAGDIPVVLEVDTAVRHRPQA